MAKFVFIISTLCIPFLIQKEQPLKYISFGDSYTICTGTNSMDEQWPVILSKHLTEAGIKTQLVINPAKNGFSTQDVIDYELPLLQKNGIDFATLLIGVNDWVRQVDVAIYHKNLNYIIEVIQQKLTNKKNLMLITIPDFGVTPQGKLYSSGRDISKGIAGFNEIIKIEAKKRGLVCVDIFPLSKGMTGNKDLTAEDQLHPSSHEYTLWEKMIFPEAKKLLMQ